MSPGIYFTVRFMGVGFLVMLYVIKLFLTPNFGQGFPSWVISAPEGDMMVSKWYVLWSKSGLCRGMDGILQQ